MNILIYRENETNKRKLQQLQIKFDESQSKEQGTLAKLQECIQIVEQSQFEKNEVCQMSTYFRVSILRMLPFVRLLLNVTKLKLNLWKHRND